MYYQLQIVNVFREPEIMLLTHESDDPHERDDLAHQEALRIVEERNKGSARVKRATLYRLEHVWSESYNTDPDH